MFRMILILGLTVGLTSWAFNQEVPMQKSGGPGKPLTPQEEQKTFRLPEGLTIELVACEPQVESPVHMSFDARGRLWVVEMRDYPNGPGPGQPPQGRIRILEDKDGDGFFETSTVFADKLLFANGLLHWKDGVIVTAAPHIVYLRDTEGDGVADQRDVWFEGFAALNPQLRVSHPTLGPDGWVYVANGLRGGAVVRAGDKSAEPINLSGLDFRFDPHSLQGEAISGLGQFGNTFDDWGNRFVCDNRHHLRYIAIENRYLKRNPALAAPTLVHDISVLEDGPLSSGGRIFPLSKNWTTSSLHEGRFTAACGVFVYRGALLPAPYPGSAFTCDPTGNLVHQEILEPKGASFQAHPAKKGVEFLASPDDWFRPVSLATGPDGALYVVDMYRAVIEHPEFMPPELRTRPDLTLGKDKGRIWRIVPKDHRHAKQDIDLNKATAAELVEYLDHPSDWWRSTAQRLLLERKESASVNRLRDLARKGRPQARLLAGWLLEQMIYLDGATLDALLHDSHPRVREQAVRLAELRLEKSKEVRERVLEMAGDPDPRVRFQVALTLGEIDDPRVSSALTKVLLAGADDSWTRLAVASSLKPTEKIVAPGTGRVGTLLEAVLEAKEFRTLARPAQISLLREFAALAGREPVGLSLVLAAKNTNELSLQLAFCNGLADGMARKNQNLHDYFLRTYPNPNNPIIQWLREFFEQAGALARDPTAPLPDRLGAIQLFAHLSWTSAEKTLPPLIQDDPHQEVRLAAVRSLAAHGGKDVSKILLQPWRGYTPAVRREVTEALFRNADGILHFLGEIQAKRIKPGDLDSLRTRQVLNHKLPNIRTLANQLLKENIPADRLLTVQKYQPALKLAGDGMRGREVFKKNCATCHRVAGIGVDVGPDIADTRTKTLEGLLVDILNPNQAIDNNYVQYLITTTSGKSLTGIIASESASSILLKRAEGQTDTVLRRDVETIQSSGVSLMPEGMEKTITLQEMADLLRFLKNWRYLDGTVPLQLERDQR